MKFLRLWLVLSLPLVLSACGGGDEDGGCTRCGDGGNMGMPDAGGGGNWTPFITGDWSLAPGAENTSDLHGMTLERDYYIKALRPIEPPGTHHTVLAVNDANFGNIIYASGVGTNHVMFPDGVGLKLEKGTSIVLQLHVYNTSNEPLSGTSGVEIIEVDASEVTTQADMFLPGPFDISLPPGQTTKITSTCTISEEQHVFALFPHMHQLGVHFKTSLVVGGQTMVVHDAPYDFNEQAFVEFAPVKMMPGDQIITECTWNNTTSQTVGWGESSDAEMCFSIMYRYPAAGSDLCAN